MKWKIAVVGKPALAYAKSGAAEYLKRLQRYTSADIVYLKESDVARADAPASPLAKLRDGALFIALDERGDRWTTTQFREHVDTWENSGEVKRIVFFIGGADGHDPTIRDGAAAVLSLSSFTLQHELALVVVLEQLYRVYTMKRGEPYHR
ncbi:MAG: 23S rRNA (pseudouridine1915-N3)-methyltransferase [Verrucomicrobiales bacterium]|jgi:23S rRNA (pseudouridine1915-N3)-methyltransferase